MNEHPLEHKITLDLELIAKKEQILMKYYQLSQEKQILELLQQWPSSIASYLKETEQIHKTNNARYFGITSNDMFHGYGLLIYDNPQGRFFQGDFQNNCKHGNGLEFIRGDIYVGNFINNKPEDQDGVFMWKNGDIFHGSFINGMKHGHGKWESGQDYYDGLWKFNKPQGQGKIHTKTSDYEGQIKNGYKHGRGIEIFVNGDKYQGQYANGKPQGDGIYEWSNGALYKGQFKNGIRYGYGQWIYGKEKYEGQYVNDKRNGQGIYKWDGGSYYKGEFVDDMRHGFGEMHWSEGAFYKGEWKEGIQSGYGELWENGKLVSKGMFEDGKYVNVKTPSITTKSVDKPNRYAGTENKQKARNSFHPILQKIEESPKNNVKKNVASTSFSHHTNHTRISRKSDNTNLINSKLNEERKQYLGKRQNKISETPDARKTNMKKKLPQKGPKPLIDMTETQLGPIKWKNFRNMKSPTNYPNLPQI